MTAPDGVVFLDHTADVGIDVTAPSLELLFHRAALGMMALVHGRDDPPEVADADGAEPDEDEPDEDGPDGARSDVALAVELDADDVVGLLADWLRELLFLHATRHAEYVRAAFDELTERGLRARVEGVSGGEPVREIKGVTYHELAAERTEGGWRGRVIFDV